MYIPVQCGFLYLVAVMDWATRRVLSWRLSNTLDARFRTETLTEALKRYGPPEIFNTDQRSQFANLEFTAVLKDAGVAISMDGRGRYLNNIFIERLWRSLKYEAVCPHELSDGFQAQPLVARWFAFYDRGTPHSALEGLHPSRGLRKRNVAGEADQAPRLTRPSVGTTGTARRVKQELGGMIDHHGIHLISAASCPTNQDHLTQARCLLAWLVMLTEFRYG